MSFSISASLPFGFRTRANSRSASLEYPGMCISTPQQLTWSNDAVAKGKLEQVASLDAGCCFPTRPRRRSDAPRGGRSPKSDPRHLQSVTRQPNRVEAVATSGVEQSGPGSGREALDDAIERQSHRSDRAKDSDSPSATADERARRPGTTQTPRHASHLRSYRAFRTIGCAGKVARRQTERPVRHSKWRLRNWSVKATSRNASARVPLISFCRSCSSAQPSVTGSSIRRKVKRK